MKSMSIKYAALFLVIGISIGHFVLPKWPAPSTLPQTQPATGWKEKLQTLADQDLTDYYCLKTLEEKYKMADEVLAKIMTIFLADLGIRMSAENLAQVKKSLSSTPTVEPTPATQFQKNSTLGGKTESAQRPDEKAKLEKWIAAEKLREDVRSQSEAADFLDKVKIDNLDDALKSAFAFKNKNNTLEVLKGHFTGTAQVKYDDKVHDWDVDLLLVAEVTDGILTGTAETKMTENGKLFSSQGDKGDIRSYKEFSSGSEAVVVRAGPTTYFQIYYLKGLDSIAGNIYKRKSEEDPFAFVGTLHLKRAG